MPINLFTPLINIEKPNAFALVATYAENYFHFGTHCYCFINMKADQTITVVESQLAKEHWFHTTLKIASMILSLGIFPLAMFVIKCLFRFYHPLFINQSPPRFSDQQLPNSSSDDQFLLNPEKQTPSKVNLLASSIKSPPLSMPENDSTKWENLHTMMTLEMHKEELEAFTQRVKVQYTQGQEPSHKQKVKYLCQELWKDGKQVPSLLQTIQNEKLTMNHLLIKEQYNRFKTLVQPYRERSFMMMTIKLFEQYPMLAMSFSKFVEKKNASDFFSGQKRQYENKDVEKTINLFREWFNLEETHRDLTAVTMLNLENSIIILSEEMQAYLSQMTKLKKLSLSSNSSLIISKSVQKLCTASHSKNGQNNPKNRRTLRF